MTRVRVSDIPLRMIATTRSPLARCERDDERFIETVARDKIFDP